MKWNESGFRTPLCTYRLNWARRASWGWWDDWDDTVLQTQDSKFEPWRSEAEHATSRSRRLPIILTFTRGWGRNIFVSFKPPRPGTEPRTLAWKAAVLTTTLGPPPTITLKQNVRLQGGICPEKFQLDKYQNADLRSLLNLICVISGKRARQLDHYCKTKCAASGRDMLHRFNKRIRQVHNYPSSTKHCNLWFVRFPPPSQWTEDSLSPDSSSILE